MDSSLEVKNNPIVSKEFVTQNLNVFEKILCELESISEVAKGILFKNVCNNGKVDNAILEKFKN